MKQMIIEGNKMLSGTIKVNGSKNSALALIPASLLSDETVTIDNIPHIADIDSLNEILEYLGADIKLKDGTMIINSSSIINKEIPEEASKKLRASYYFMAALLGKYKEVRMYFPGGCNIGKRPIDQTLKAFEALGAVVEENDNQYYIHADELVGGNILLDMPSVGATINTMLAAVKAKGETIIDNAAKEPEIVNVATLLNNMGAKITGAGTSEIRIKGVSKLRSAYSEVIPDRIVAGTYVIMGALIGDNLKIDNLIPEHIESLTLKLKEMGVKLKINGDNIIVSKSDKLKPVKVKTLGYPGFPTDLQQPLTVLLAFANGLSTLEETIYENRFQNVEYLNKMGTNIEVNNKKIRIKGSCKLCGKEVKATDLRAGACMILAGLCADGETIVTDVEHVLRGYEDIVESLTDIGAKIRLEEI
ncbi:MAG: UDP-N-acetylglucosamine 1-carboxyvinyltransferase [Mycoplasmatota bacterium]